MCHSPPGGNQAVGSVEGQWISRRVGVVGEEELAGAAGGEARASRCHSELVM